MRKAIIVGCALSVASFAGAQSVAEYERRFEAATARMRRAEVAMGMLRDSVTKAVLQRDTLRVGPFTALVAKSDAPVIATQLEHALAILGPAYEGSLDRLSDLTLSVTLEREGAAPTYTTYLVNGAGKVVGNEFTTADTVTFALMLSRRFSDRIWNSAPPDLKDLVGSAPLLDSGTTREWATHRIDLVSTGTIVGQRCYDGDIRACRQLLDLEATADKSREWFDSATANQYVARNRKPFHRQWGALTDSCLAGSDASCRMLLARSPFPLAKTSSLLASLVQEGAIVGGRGSLARLMAANGTLGDRLAAMSGVPVDSLVTRWRQHLLTARTSSETITPGFGLLAVGWMIVFAGLSTRSSRWR